VNVVRKRLLPAVVVVAKYRKKKDELRLRRNSSFFYMFVCILRALTRTQNAHKHVLHLGVAAGDPPVWYFPAISWALYTSMHI